MAKYLLGPILLLAAAFTWGLGNVLLSFVTQTVAADEAIFAVYAMSAVIIAPFYRPGAIKNFFNFSKQFILMTIYFMTSSLAFAYSDPNDVTAIFMLTIFITPMFARCILGTTFNMMRVTLTLFWSFSGIILLVQPPILLFRENVLTARNILGYGLAICALIARSLLTVYQNEEKVDEMAMTFWTPFGVCTIMGIKIAIGEPNWNFSLGPILIMVLIAALYQVGTFCSFMGWRMTDPMISALVYQSQIIFTFISYLFIDGFQNATILRVSGIFLVISSVCTYQYLENKETVEVEMGNAYKTLQDSNTLQPPEPVPFVLTGSLTFSSLR